MPAWNPKANDIFLSALEIAAPAQRQAFIAQACSDSGELLSQVESLLAASQRAGSFLESPPPAVAIDTLAQPAEKTGMQIGPYKLLQQIGEGGMGVVFMAEQTEPVERRVALKIIKPGMDSRQVIARFEAERQALAMMDHPNIAKVLEAGTTDSGRPYFVMELVKGIPITKYCDEKHLSLQQRLELMIPICQAIQHAHQKGIIHRDIKPNNVLVAQYDGKPVPKVIDFGVAKATAQKLTERTMFTELGQIIGTLEYMSPEQAELNQLDIDTRSDIYSLGVLLYELLTGSTPFDKQKLRAAAFHEMLRIIREDEPPKPSTNLSTSGTLPAIAANRHTDPARLCKAVRGELDWIVMKALEKDRNRRYESANGLASDIQRYLNDEHVLACPPSATYRLRKFVRRYKGLVLATSIVFATLLAGIAGTSWGLVRSNQAWQSEALRAQAETRERLRAETAERDALAQKKQADTNSTKAKQHATDALDKLQLATAVTEFLTHDLLIQASSKAQADRRFVANPNLSVREALDRAAATVGEKFHDRPALEASIRHTIGNAYHAVGQTQLAIEQLQQVVDIRRKLLPTGDLQILSALSDLAGSYLTAGRHTEAIELFQEVCDGRNRILGEDHQLALQALNNLAGAYFYANQLDQSIPRFELLLAAQQRTLGDLHPDTLRTLGNLGVNYLGQGNLAKAMPKLELAREGRLKVLGPDHPDTLDSNYELVRAYYEDGRHPAAIELCKLVVAGRTQVLGPKHLETLKAINELSRMYLNAGQHHVALPFVKQARDGYLELFGPENSLTLIAQVNLAEAYEGMGQIAESRTLSEQIRPAVERVLGAEDRYTLSLQHSLAMQLWRAKEYDQSIPIFEQMLAVRWRMLGENHQETIRTLANLGVNYKDSGDLAKGIQRLADAHRRAKGNAALAWITDQLVEAYQLDKQHSAVEVLLREQIERAKGPLGPTVLTHRQLLSTLCRNLVQQEKYALAEATARECLLLCEPTPAEAGLRTFNKSVIGKCLFEQKKYAEAEPWLLEVQEETQQRYASQGNRARAILAAPVQRLIELYETWEKPQEAAKWHALLRSIPEANP